ncbi:zinc transporter ZupT [archaeon]|jgi:zinc transporter, ZIP family|nr:zinc transporter ZupT [archaeon]MBT3720537.1 zinc transporter ZupT [archaeon]MBT4022164.1 zinc transporter ZupT [archaeon]MBT4272777.1 zinc transporter ZupT [archaeon]MBT4461576.1 zinc transporter ZupT [archaeon]
MLNAFLLTVFAGLSTVLGSLIVLFVDKKKEIHLNIAMGFAAGVMIFISFTELLNQSIVIIGYATAMASFFAGILFIYAIDVLIPHEYEKEESCKHGKNNKNLKRCGTLLAVGIAIHNFPEGIAVFFSSLANIKLGIAMAVAIALHNIPEGIAIAMPIYYATKSRKTAFMYSLLSGIAEPIGALIAWFFLRNYMTTFVLNILLAAVAGIMVFISFDELLPYAYNVKQHHPTVFGILMGMIVMAISLHLIV